MELADVRLQNTLLLRDHFGRKWRAEGDERARTLETSFANLVEVNPSHWSQIKSGHRHIGEKLARQIEAKCKVPQGSLEAAGAEEMPAKMQPQPVVECQNEDERHAMQLFQVLYRMNPQATKSRLLEVLQGELLKQDATKPASRASVIPLGRGKR
ncbi:MAG: hypothetical protein ACOVNS_09805 [Erythrobacter sp.]|jgi:hypothetical protein